MKKLILILFLISIVLISGCDKKIVYDSDTEKVANKNIEENERVKYLFDKNNLSLENLRLDRISEEKDFGINHLNLTHVRVTQEYKGLPILHSQIIFHFTQDEFSSTSGDRISDLNVDVNPKITKESAISIIKNRANNLRPDIKLDDKDIILGIYDKKLAYWVDNIVVVVINAYDGKVLHEFDGIFT